MYLRRGKDFLLHLFNGHSLANGTNETQTYFGDRRYDSPR